MGSAGKRFFFFFFEFESAKIKAWNYWQPHCRHEEAESKTTWSKGLEERNRE